MKRVAICISGEPRLWRVGARDVALMKQHLETDGYEVDVFIHFWDKLTPRIRESERLNPDFLTLDIPIVQSDINEHYAPTRIRFESKNELDTIINVLGDMVPYRTIPNLDCVVKYSNWPGYSQIYSLIQALSMAFTYAKENTTTYDAIIRTRSDVAISNNVIGYGVEDMVRDHNLAVARIALINDPKFTLVEVETFVLNPKNLNTDLLANADVAIDKLLAIARKYDRQQGTLELFGLLMRYVYRATIIGNWHWGVPHALPPGNIGREEYMKLENTIMEKPPYEYM